MTLRLVLIRHAKSDQHAGLPDHERPLNARGRRDAPLMGRWIADGGFAPAAVLCSDAQRTRETLGLMLPAWSSAPRAAYRPDLYAAAPAAMLAALAEAPTDAVAMIGHNPGVGQLAQRLAARAPDHPRWEDYPTSAVAVLAFEAEAWADVAAGTGEVLAFAVPADLD